MKKRLLILALVLVFILAAFAGCGGKPAGTGGASPVPPGASASAGGTVNIGGGGSSNSGTNTNSGNNANNGGGDNSGGSTPSNIPGYTGTPADAYKNYLTVKNDGYTRITTKIQDNSELTMSVGLSLLGVAMGDLALLPLSIVGVQGGEAALGMLGITNFNITQNGDVYTITYDDGQGNTDTQTVEYDAATDSMKSVVTSGGQESMYFEFVKVSGGYASQYSMYSEDSGYSMVKCYVTSDIAAFGIYDATADPPSIFKNTAVQDNFVQNNSFYVIMQGDQLTVFNDGTTNTY